MKTGSKKRNIAVRESTLDSLRRRGLRADGFEKGYKARDAIMHAAQMIRDMRTDAGLTQAQLAERAGMTQPEISRLEAGLGKHGPGIETLQRLAIACDLRLFMGVQDMTTPVTAEQETKLKYLAEM